MRKDETTPERDGNGQHLTEREVFSLHGRVLLYIYVHPGLTASDIARGLSLSTHTIWSIIGDLRREEMLVVERRDRRHYYRVNPDATFLHPIVGNVRLRTILGGLASG